MDRSAYRFGGVTLAIVLLVRRVEPAWQVAFHRFAEVSTGIAVALVMTVVWPERGATTSNQQGKDIPDEPTAPAVRKEASEVFINDYPLTVQ